MPGAPVNVIASKAIRNYCINGQFAFAQRKPSGSWVNQANLYTADRWYNIGNPNTTINLQQASGANSARSMNVGRSSGSADVTTIYLLQALESIDSRELAGKVVTFSLKIRKGVTFSGTGVTIYLETGTGTDQGVAAGWTGGSSYVAPLILSASLNSSQFYQAQFTTLLSANTNQLRMGIQYTPTGVAGAADYIEITDVMLNEGSFAPFVRACGSFSKELLLCQRYYEKSFDFGAEPINGPDATSFSAVNGLSHIGAVPWASGNWGSSIDF